MLNPEPLPVFWQKRFFDVVVGGLLLVLALPLFILFTALIALEHAVRGRPFDPLFYREQRVSRGVIFRLCKFNIFDQRVVEDMRSRNIFIHTKDLEHMGQLIVVGKVLKQIYLDELPQLFNVLKGEMSLVGPRPVNLEVFARMYEKGVPSVALVLGGMTGSYQSYKNPRAPTAATLEAAYLEQYQRGGWWVVLADIKIIVRTLKVLLRAKGV